MDSFDCCDKDIIYYLCTSEAVFSKWSWGIYDIEQGELHVKLSTILFDI